MKVLIITYYWPPAGGSGVQRWLKFVKYLRDFEIEPVIFTVENPNYPIEDNTLKKDIPDTIEVLKQKIWEPNSLFGKSSKKTSAGFLNNNPSLFGKIVHYIRANYFIPDARKFWIKPSVKYLSKYFKENTIDLIISTGPPHSTHLIALGLKEKFDIKWLADFRDPWTEIDYFHQLPLTKKSLNKHKEFEQKVLKNADSVLVVGNTMAESYKQYNNNVHVITNGYDSIDKDVKVDLDINFSIVHIGMLNADRNHKMLWKSLSELCNKEEVFANDLKVKLIGKLSDAAKVDIEKYKLNSNVEVIDYLPHEEVLEHQKSAQLLLLLVNDVPSAKGIITGKIFEYLQAKRPILAIAPTDGDLAEIINQTKAGVVVDFNNKEELKNKILAFYRAYKNKQLISKTNSIEQYHRRSLTASLANIIKELI